MAAAWPTTKPDYPLGEKTILPQVRTEFEAGYVMSRPRCTRSRGKWTCTWKLMLEAEYQNLLLHFQANQGDSWTWTHPVTAATYTVRYSGDDLSGSVPQPGYRSVSVELEEV